MSTPHHKKQTHRQPPPWVNPALVEKPLEPDENTALFKMFAKGRSAGLLMVEHWIQSAVGLIVAGLLGWAGYAIGDATVAAVKSHNAFQRQLQWRVIPQHNSIYSNSIPDILIRLERLEAFTNSLQNPLGSVGILERRSAVVERNSHKVLVAGSIPAAATKSTEQ